MMVTRVTSRRIRFYPIKIYDIIAADYAALIEKILDIVDRTYCPVVDIAARTTELPGRTMVVARLVSVARIYREV